MDSELTQAERAEMERHARECASCAQLLDRATTLATMCAELNEGLQVPLNAQAAWRQAVRSEAAQKKKRAPLSVWSRGVGAVAAALVLLVTGTYGMRGAQPVFSGVSPSSAVIDIAADESGVDRVMPMRAVGVKSPGSLALRSDGGGDTRSTADYPAQEALESVFLRSARREILSHSYESDAIWLENLVNEYDAYFEEHSQTMAQADVGRSLNAVVCVPSERLDEFLMELEQLGETTLRSESVQDVTDSYIDAQARLTALEEQKATLEELRGSAQALTDVLAIEQQLTDVQTEIQRLTRDTGDLTSYSRVTLVLTEALENVSAQADAGAESAELGARMKAGFDASVVWLKQFMQDALVVLATAAPRLVVWIPALVLVIILLRAIFRRRK